MQALATPIIAIVQGARAYTFVRRAADAGGATYVPNVTDVPALAEQRPGTVFEDGRCYVLVPDKFYRYEDRLSYLRDLYPQVRLERIAVSALPQLGAMAVYDADERVPPSLRSGNHVNELFLHCAGHLAEATPTMGFAFFCEGSMWLTLLRAGEVVLSRNLPVQAHSDAVFHLAAMLGHYGLDRATTRMVVAGRIAPEGQLQRELEIYFRVEDVSVALAAQALTPPLELLLAYQDAVRSPIASA